MKMSRPTIPNTMMDSVQFRTLEHAQMLRGTQSIAAAIGDGDTPAYLRLAPDEWEITSPIVLSKQCVIVGTGATTKINISRGVSGPAISVTASAVALVGLTLKSSETTLGTGYTAIKVTASDVIIDSCAFDGFVQAIEINGANRVQVKNCVAYNQTGTVINMVDAEFCVISHNMILKASGTGINLDSNCRRNVIAGNQCLAGATNIDNSPDQANVYAANQPAATVT